MHGDETTAEIFTRLVFWLLVSGVILWFAFGAPSEAGRDGRGSSRTSTTTEADPR
jgi:hypothetical protein